MGMTGDQRQEFLNETAASFPVETTRAMALWGAPTLSERFVELCMITADAVGFEANDVTLCWPCAGLESAPDAWDRAHLRAFSFRRSRAVDVRRSEVERLEAERSE